MDPIVCRECSFQELEKLREKVLLPFTNRTSALFPGDLEPTSFHFGTFKCDQCLCCLTYHLSTWENQSAFQLRGMATDPAFQGLGLGKTLLAYSIESLLMKTEIRLLWCNARVGAVGFYEKQGWCSASGPFQIDGVGPHIKMIRNLSV